MTSTPQQRRARRCLHGLLFRGRAACCVASCGASGDASRYFCGFNCQKRYIPYYNSGIVAVGHVIRIVIFLKDCWLPC